MHLFYLNKGCQQYRSGFYLANGVLDGPDVVDACREVEPCGMCPICDESWGNMLLPVLRSQVERFF
jgi:hypothetical protein